MRATVKTLLGALLAVTCATATAEVVQVWECTLDEGKTFAELDKASSAWLKAARSMAGGSELKAYHELPLAASAGQGGFNFVLVAPDAATWGTFWNSYDASAAAQADEEWDNVAGCSGSSLWNSNAIK
jgi:hypothetical protein